jgi:glycosyltransferase involved in cell wall biosynthesis
VKFAILTQYYPPEIGAPQARLSGLAKQLVAAGHQVTVLTAMPNYPAGKIQDGYGGLLRRESLGGIDVIRTLIYPTQKANIIPRLTNYLSFVGSACVFGSFLLEKPDYLLVESPPLFLGLAGIWLSWLKRTRMIFNVSDLWPESAVRLGVLDRGTLAYRLSEQLESFCYRNAWLVTGQSRGILSDISRRFPTSATYHLSNGVDIEMFNVGPREMNLEAAKTSSSLITMYAGLHGLAQGLDQVLKAASELATEPFQFVLVGDGPEKCALMKEANKEGLRNVRFCDARPAHEIPSILASADVLLVMLKTYIPGAVPSKLYEAMASGKPLVLVGKGEAAKIVRESEAGIVIEPGDSGGFADALRTLRKNPELRRRMGGNGRQAAEENFDRQKIIQRFIEHLEVSLPHAPSV